MALDYPFWTRYATNPFSPLGVGSLFMFQPSIAANADALLPLGSGDRYQPVARVDLEQVRREQASSASLRSSGKVLPADRAPADLLPETAARKVLDR